MRMSEEDYSQHRGDYDGYCTRCDAITREGGTEPDARFYGCPQCKQKTCMGMEVALLRGDVDILEDGEGS